MKGFHCTDYLLSSYCTVFKTSSNIILKEFVMKGFHCTDSLLSSYCTVSSKSDPLFQYFLFLTAQLVDYTIAAA